jgi:hypothetical protein
MFPGNVYFCGKLKRKGLLQGLARGDPFVLLLRIWLVGVLVKEDSEELERRHRDSEQTSYPPDCEHQRQELEEPD